MADSFSLLQTAVILSLLICVTKVLLISSSDRKLEMTVMRSFLVPYLTEHSQQKVARIWSVYYIFAGTASLLWTI